MLFQGRMIELDLGAISIQRKGDGWQCYEHRKHLPTKPELRNHVRAEHWPFCSSLWTRGVPS